MWPGDGGLERSLSGVLPGPTYAVGAGPGRPAHWPALPAGVEENVYAPDRLRQKAGQVDGFIAVLPTEGVDWKKLVTVGSYTVDEFHGVRDNLRRPYRAALALWWLLHLEPRWFVLACQDGSSFPGFTQHPSFRGVYNRRASYPAPEAPRFLYGRREVDGNIAIRNTIADIVKEVSRDR